MPKSSKMSRVQVMSRLLEASKLLNSTLDLKELLRIILNLATESCKADRGTIYLIDRKTNEIWSHIMKENEGIEIRLPLGEGIAGYVGSTGETINLKDSYKDPRFSRKTDLVSGFRTTSMLTMPMRNSSGTIIGVFQLLNKEKGKFNKQDEEYLSLLSVHASLAIENAMLHRKAIKQESIEKELDIAASIQRLLLPSILPQIKGVSISAFNIPSRSVSGDFYDVIRIDDERILAIIADVAGKGVPAALLVSTMQAWLHALIEGAQDLKSLVTKLNQVIQEGTTIERYITFFAILLDSSSNKFEYVNAGHLPQLYISNGTIQELSVGGFPLGMFPDSKYESETLSFKTGDAFSLFTDGITEAVINSTPHSEQNFHPKEKDFFGDERVYEFFKNCSHLPFDKVLPTLLEEINKHLHQEQVNDDLTAIYIRTHS